MVKSGREYDEVFEELMFYEVVNVNSIRSRGDIAEQLRFDKRIGFMRNRNLFIDKMLDTFPAKLLSSGKLKNNDIKKINDYKSSFGKNNYKTLVDTRFRKRFESTENRKDYIMVDGYLFNKKTKLYQKVNARLDLLKMENGRRVILRDTLTGKFVSSKEKKKNNNDKR